MELEWGLTGARTVQDNEEVRYIVEDCEFEPVLFSVVGEFAENELEEAKEFCLEYARKTRNHHRIRDVENGDIYHTKIIWKSF